MSSDVFNALPVPVMEFAPVRDDAGKIVDFNLTWANEAALGVESITLDQAVGLSILTLDQNMAKSEGFSQMINTVEDNKTYSMVTEMRHGLMYLGKIAKFVTAPSASGCAVIMQDVSDVVAERDAARGSLKLMEAACEGAVNGMAIASGDHKIIYANPTLCEMLKYAPEELIGEKAGKILHPDEINKRYADAEKMMAGEVDQYTVDRIYVAKDGENIQMSVAVAKRQDADGNTIYIGNYRDVREERKVQAELADALDKAEESTRMKSEFLANMSHEIRTPLNGVVGMAQVLSYSDLDKQQAEHLGIIRESSSNLMSLLNDILDLSKVEAGKIEISPVETDLRHKLNGLFKLHAPSAEDKGLDFDLVIHPAVPSRLQIDPVRMRQCVSNLISNAIKFTQAGRIVVAVTSEPVEDEVRVTIHVSDTGIGIAPDKLNQVFESFQQADGSTTRSFGGTGLGLTITRKLAALMGGDLNVVSEQGRGSVFTLSFLAKPAVSVDGALDRLHAEHEDMTHGTNFSERKALVVDDNMVNRQVARTFLKAYGFQVVEAVDGLEAVEKSSITQFDVILMDIHMPRLDGVSAARQIRDSNKFNETVPIVALTADAMSGDRERYLGLGMNGYVSKPINERELIGAVGQVLSIKDKLIANW